MATFIKQRRHRDHRQTESNSSQQQTLRSFLINNVGAGSINEGFGDIPFSVMHDYVQDVLDLIKWTNGDTSTIRGKNGQKPGISNRSISIISEWGGG
ncbi:MAG: hypothetical protein DWQ10_16150 [Calditrichaeota bacterium]|nr:MAG: hypothetical protein DWQ10_16150 [Calditrichota bacterium]